MLAVLFVATSLGLSNFAAGIAIGLSGIDAGIQSRVAVAFGLFEGGMPLLGLLLGRQLADALGAHVNVLGGVLLVETGG
jgi:putative Mn2+ efflux pump MntP